MPFVPDAPYINGDTFSYLVHHYRKIIRTSLLNTIQSTQIKMAPITTPIAAILAGKINIKIHCRVIHMWTVPDYNNPNEDGCMHMLLLDEKVH